MLYETKLKLEMFT